MLKVTVCIGSSCHVKGSRQIVDELRYLVKENHLEDKVELAGSFCLGKCEQGVCVTVDGQLFSVQPDKAKDFFENEIVTRI